MAGLDLWIRKQRPSSPPHRPTSSYAFFSPLKIYPRWWGQAISPLEGFSSSCTSDWKAVFYVCVRRPMPRSSCCSFTWGSLSCWVHFTPVPSYPLSRSLGRTRCSKFRNFCSFQRICHFLICKYLIRDEGRKLWFYSENWSSGGRKSLFIHSFSKLLSSSSCGH